MSTPTIRALERRLARQQASTPSTPTQPTPDDLYRGARHLLRLDPAKARRFAGLEDPAPFVLPAIESPPADWRVIAGGLMRNVEELMMQQRRPAAREDDDAAGVPAATSPAQAPTPPTPPSKQPVEAILSRGIDGRLERAQVGDQRFNFMRDLNGKISGADSDRQSVVFQRGLDGRISGARYEPKEPKS